MTTWSRAESGPASASDQAARLRQLVRTPRPEAVETKLAPIIAIASGKGGVGKSSISVNLAISLAQSMREVVLLDGDLGLANTDILCGRLTADHLGDVLDGERTVEEVSIDVCPGLTLIPGGSGVARLAQLSGRDRVRLVTVLDQLRRDRDVMIIDCGAGIGTVVRALACAADRLMVVTTPEPTSVADAYGLIKTLSLSGGRVPPIGLIVNQARDDADARSVHRRIAAVSDRFLGEQPTFIGAVPQDPRVAEAARRQKPFVLGEPRCRASRRVRALGASIAAEMALQRSRDGHETGKVRRFLRLCNRHRPRGPSLE
ncbi:MAG: MinD/ParA family protein [Phycisphaerales bacterium]